MPRLNRVIELIEQGKVAFGPLVPTGSIPDATLIGSTQYDACVFELEHGPFDLAGR
ncbi:MAG TPA: hypothetical protein VGL23_13930 [Chloroflexota bacterium]|jgi:hypothetical protein